MRDQEIIGLYEAYASIYAPKEDEVVEEIEQLDEGPIETIRKAGEGLGKVVAGAAPAVNRALKQGGEKISQLTGIPINTTKRQTERPTNEEVETDLFDYILEYLVAEGYADTNENALVIMTNMSEEWRQSIVEADSLAAFEARRAKRRAAMKKKTGYEGHDYSKPHAQADAEREERFRKFVNKED